MRIFAKEFYIFLLSDHLNLYLSEKYNITENDYKDYPSEDIIDKEKF